MHGDLLLLHGAQVAGADVVANLREVESFLIRRCREGQHLLAPAGGELGGERVLDLAERARADAAVIRNRLALLGGADLHLRSSGRGRCTAAQAGSAPALQTGFSRSCSTNSSLEMLLTDAVSEIDGSRAALASCTRLERGRHAPIGCDDVGPALEQLRRQSGRNRARPRSQAR